ncbi:MAG: stage 0 sporulation protein [Candidatus Omnitrophica bacterium]|nr:stage 0 sporulation protein [Candidatus Omnitrophota bacterium]
MAKLIQVQIGEYRSIAVVDAANVEVVRGDFVIAEVERSSEFARVVSAGLPRCAKEGSSPVSGRVLRKATDGDHRQMDNNRTKSREALNVCISKVNDLSLDMKVLKAEYSFDSTKIIFFFIAEGRVDFRNLVKELAKVFRVRIELKQIGVRDRAKMIAGYGVCGQPLCCSSFIRDFSQLSIKMAKEQALPLNPSKISGVCSRIKCCMAYEFSVYRELNRGLPKIGAKVQIAEGKGRVINLDILKRLVYVDVGEGKIVKYNVPKDAKDEADKKKEQAQ